MDTIVVTGASRGIGAGVTETLTKDGYTVVGIARREGPLQEVAEKTGMIPVQGDMGDLDALPALYDKVMSVVDHVDGVVHCAGLSVVGLFQEIKPEDASYLYRVNFLSIVEWTRLLLPGMLQRHHGNIISIASIWGEVGGACEVDYSATKAGILGFTRALAKEVGPSGVRVNAISPGAIETDMTAPLSEETLQMLIDAAPMKRLGKPADVAHAVEFLLSEDSSFITGQDLAVNGGWNG